VLSPFPSPETQNPKPETLNHTPKTSTPEHSCTQTSQTPDTPTPQHLNTPTPQHPNTPTPQRVARQVERTADSGHVWRDKWTALSEPPSQVEVQEARFRREKAEADKWRTIYEKELAEAEEAEVLPPLYP